MRKYLMSTGPLTGNGPGIYLCSYPFAEGFQCLLEHIIVYTRKELFPKEKKLVRYHAKFKEANVLNDYMELNIGRLCCSSSAWCRKIYGDYYPGK